MNTDDAIAALSATELRRRVGKRELSPVDVVEACLARIERFNDDINAVVTLNEHAMDDARALESAIGRGEDPGLLCGLPVGIKDVTPVAGLRTTFGSTMYTDYVPDEDALVVRRLRAAGAIVLGKTNCPEFAAGGNTFNEVFGLTRNPWDRTKSAGGSTGGGAAALSTGMIALAEGTDLGGSLRIPASFCGVVGLRPSPGLVPTYPTDYLWDTLQVTGPMARTVDDVALMLQAVCGADSAAPLAQPVEGRDFVAAARVGITGPVRIAYCPDVAGIGIDPGVEAVCRHAVLELSQVGAHVEVVEVDLRFALDAFLALRGHWMVSHQFTRLDRRESFGPNVAANVRSGLDVTTEQLGSAEHARGRLWALFAELFGKFDHLVTPTMAVPPFPVDQNYPETVAGRAMETYVHWIAPTFVLSLAGLPVASVPAGLDENGLPVGLQVVGRPRGEEGVLAVARSVQEMNPIGVPPIVS